MLPLHFLLGVGSLKGLISYCCYQESAFWFVYLSEFFFRDSFLILSSLENKLLSWKSYVEFEKTDNANLFVTRWIWANALNISNTRHLLDHLWLVLRGITRSKICALKFGHPVFISRPQQHNICWFFFFFECWNHLCCHPVHMELELVFGGI